MSDNQDNAIKRLLDVGRRYLALNLDYARLTAAEKLTILLSTIAFYSLVTIMGTLVLVFLSIGIGHLLATTVARVAAYLYVAAFYLVLFILLFVFRRKLIVDPVCKFITKLFVKPPENNQQS